MGTTDYRIKMKWKTLMWILVVWSIIIITFAFGNRLLAFSIFLMAVVGILLQILQNNRIFEWARGRSNQNEGESDKKWE